MGRRRRRRWKSGGGLSEDSLTLLLIEIFFSVLLPHEKPYNEQTENRCKQASEINRTILSN